jgi:hypothetical protein
MRNAPLSFADAAAGFAACAARLCRDANEAIANMANNPTLKPFKMRMNPLDLAASAAGILSALESSHKGAAHGAN